MRHDAASASHLPDERAKDVPDVVRPLPPPPDTPAATTTNPPAAARHPHAIRREARTHPPRTSSEGSEGSDGSDGSEGSERSEGSDGSEGGRRGAEAHAGLTFSSDGLLSKRRRVAVERARGGAVTPTCWFGTHARPVGGAGGWVARHVSHGGKPPMGEKTHRRADGRAARAFRARADTHATHRRPPPCVRPPCRDRHARTDTRLHGGARARVVLDALRDEDVRVVDLNV